MTDPVPTDPLPAHPLPAHPLHTEPARDRFRADCSRCAGLCCVALSRSVAGGFGADDPAGTPCANLRPDNLCTIHTTLRPDGWPACTVFDCFGAGQQTVSQVFAGRDWRDPEVREPMFAVFAVLRQLMEVLRHLDEASRRLDHDLHAELDALMARLETLVNAPAPDLMASDPTAWRAEAGPLLAEVSRQHRARRLAVHTVRPGRSSRLRAHAQFLGADLRREDFTGAELRGALLIAANLSNCRLAATDLLGADLRDADLRGADLSSAIFLTQPQLEQAIGDAHTVLPSHLDRPGHWT